MVQDMNKIIWLIIGLCMISLVQAASDDIVEYNTWDFVDLKQTCINEITSSKCSETAVCNLTIVGPDSNILINEQPMIHQGAFFNYSLGMMKKGDYPVYVICRDGTELSYQTYTLRIKENEADITFIVTLAIMAFMSLLIGYVLSDAHMILKVFFLFFSIILVIFVIPTALMNSKFVGIIFSLGNNLFYLFLTYIMIFILWLAIDWITKKFKKETGGQNEQ